MQELNVVHETNTGSLPQLFHFVYHPSPMHSQPTVT